MGHGQAVGVVEVIDKVLALLTLTRAQGHQAGQLGAGLSFCDNATLRARADDRLVESAALGTLSHPREGRGRGGLIDARCAGDFLPASVHRDAAESACVGSGSRNALGMRGDAERLSGR